MEPAKEFQIGLAMSGAISAGAYTAGVFDFLIEALDAWEKERGGADVPSHFVGLKVMSGASAGAITAAIGAVALADADQSPGSYTAKGFVYTYHLPKLYETWVMKPGLVREAGASRAFLQNDDLDKPLTPEDDFSHTQGIDDPPSGSALPVISLLNTRLIDSIAKDGIAVKNVVAGPGQKAPRPYVSKTLHIYLTLSNLRGIPYQISFEGDDYHMTSHADRVHYQVNGAGTWATDSEFADNDRKREIDVGWLLPQHPDKTQHLSWKDYSIAALASAAFPVGLSARGIGTSLMGEDGYNGRCFPIDGANDTSKIEPNWPKGVVTDEKQLFWYRTADGGIIDNDPFEYARFTLKKNLAEPNERRPEKADRAVIMISPFPEEKPIRAVGQPAPDIMSVYSALMPSLIDQARFKPTELLRAADPNYGSRYLIGPTRVIGDVEQRYGIASGLLGGFGGFVSRSFRDHDFQLGRRNCQWFLKQAFALPHTNNIFGHWTTAAKTQFLAQKKSPTEEDNYAIIPLYGDAKAEVVLPPWPQISEADLKIIEDAIAARFDYVAPKLISDTVRGFLGLLLQLATARWTSFLPLIRKRVLDYASLAILTDLVRRNQIKEWDDLGDLPTRAGLAPDDVRAVIAELLDPAFDQRTLAGIFKGAAAHKPERENGKTPELTLDKVRDLVVKLKGEAGKRYEVWEAPWKDKKGESLYTLASRAKNISFFERLATPAGMFIAKLPVVGGIGNYFPKPRTDPPGVA